MGSAIRNRQGAVGRRVDMPDGLYQVATERFAAGFVVRGGRIAHCAPILRARLDEWVQVAKRIDRSS